MERKARPGWHRPHDLRAWHPIETAPKDREIVVYAPGREGLGELVSLCQWHPDAGFCIDELREPTLWTEKP
jgi:hypothetical protein